MSGWIDGYMDEETEDAWMEREMMDGWETRMNK